MIGPPLRARQDQSETKVGPGAAAARRHQGQETSTVEEREAREPHTERQGPLPSTAIRFNPIICTQVQGVHLLQPLLSCMVDLGGSVSVGVGVGVGVGVRRGYCSGGARWDIEGEGSG